ncbi:T9SS type A sorting domain-containing protein [Candidatus Margulisiibacteriota bacterium]
MRKAAKFLFIMGIISILLLGSGISVYASWINGGGDNFTFNSPTINTVRSGVPITGNAWVEYEQSLPAPNDAWYYAIASNATTTFAGLQPIDGVSLFDVADDQGGSLLVTWNANTQSAPPTLSYYNIYVSQSPITSVAALSAVASVNAGITTASVSGYDKSLSYYAAVTAVDEEDSENSEISYTGGPTTPADNIAPASVNVTMVDVGGDNGGKLMVSWPQSTDDGAGANDVSSYKLYLSTTSNISELVVTDNLRRSWDGGLGSGFIYIASGLTNGVTYYATVIIADDSDNADDTTVVVAQAVPVDDAPPDEVLTLTVTPGDQQITLNWTNTTGSATVTLVRKIGTYPLTTTDGVVITQDMSVTEGTSSTLLDTGLVNGTKYYYALWSYDTTSNNVKATILGEPAGALVYGSIVTVGDVGGLTISANASYVTNYYYAQDEYGGNPPADFVGSGWGFNLVGTGGTPDDTVTISVYMGDGVVPSGNLYKIPEDGGAWVGPLNYVTDGPTVNLEVTLDSNGDIDPLFVFGTDTVNPDDVIGLTLQIVTKNIKLTWSNPDTSLAQNLDLAGIVVRRSTTGYPGATGGDEIANGDITSYMDTEATASDNTRYFYAVYAYDNSTPVNYSAGKFVMALTDFSAPQTGTDFSVSNIGGTDGTAVELRWTKSTSEATSSDVKRYRIYRSTTTENVAAMALIKEVRPKEKNVLTIDNDGITKNTTYYYALTAIDEAGNEDIDNAASDSIYTVDSLAPPVVSGLMANVTTDDVVLTWTNPTDMSDVSGNWIVRKAGSFPSGPADGTVLWSYGATENFTDASVPQDDVYYYYVYTVDASNNYAGNMAKIVHRNADGFGSGTYSTSSQYSAFGAKSRYAASMTIVSETGTVGQVVFNSATSWSCDLNMPEGENILIVTSYTIDGSILNSYEQLLVVDMIPPAPPQVVINGLELLERGVVYTNINLIKIKGTAEPGVKIQLQASSAKLGIQSLVDAGLTNSDALGNYEMELELSEGINYVSITAVDPAGNATAVSGRVVLDTVLPSINEVTFDGNKAIDGDRISATPLIKVKLYDAASGIDARAVTLSIDGVVKTNLEVSIGSGSNSVIEVSYQVPSALSAGTHNVKVEVKDLAGSAASITLSDLVVAVTQQAEIAGTILNYPNPFNPETESTKLAYQLTAQADVDVYIYSITGKRIFHKVIETGEAGSRVGYNEVAWDGRDSFGDMVGNGVYLVHIVTDDGGGKKLLGKVKVLVMR